MSLTETIEHELPYDGPQDPDTVTEAALGLAALVRYLNNATGPWNAPKTLQHAPTVDAVLGGIEAASHGLDQLLAQLADALVRQADDPTLYDDRGGSLAAHMTADAARYHLRFARRAAAALGEDLASARGYTAHLGHNLAGEER